MAKDTDGGQQRANRASAPAEEATVDATDTGDIKERHEKLTDDVDDLLDEIDSVLEENAEDFVKGYIQKGGE